MGKICGLFGKTRQAWYVKQWSQEDDTISDSIVIKRVKEIREKMPRIGTRKLYHMLGTVLEEHQIRIGRDKLFDLLEDHGLLVRRRKRRKVSTTDSNHPFRRYPNLTKGMNVLGPNQLWVSDITYIRQTDGFCYLSLVTDAYSRKIVGYCLYPTLQKEGPIIALQQALDNTSASMQMLMHHSDRGRQYCCDAYVSILSNKKIVISMTEKGDPYENAIAERVNGILKDEFMLDQTFPSYDLALTAVNNAVATYNADRPHSSCNYQVPDLTHQQYGQQLMRWKKRERKKPIIA